MKTLFTWDFQLCYSTLSTSKNSCIFHFCTYPIFGDIHIWDKIFKNGPGKNFKGCLPQILLAPFLNTLSHIKLLFTSLRFSSLVNCKPPIGIFQETANITIFSAIRVYKKTITFKKFYFCGNAPLNCFLQISASTFTIAALIFLLIFFLRYECRLRLFKFQLIYENSFY